MSQKRIGRAAGFLLLLGMTAAWSVPSVPLAQEQPGSVLDGKTIYQWHCLRCHGTGGWGDGPQAKELRVAPANFHAPAVQTKSDEQLLTSIEFGLVLSPMHGWRGRLTEQEMQDVVAYIRLLGQRGR